MNLFQLFFQAVFIYRLAFFPFQLFLQSRNQGRRRGSPILSLYKMPDLPGPDIPRIKNPAGRQKNGMFKSEGRKSPPIYVPAAAQDPHLILIDFPPSV